MSARETFGEVPRPLPSSAHETARGKRSPLRDRERFSSKASYQYRKKREMLLPHIMERSACLAGLPSATVTVDRKQSNESRLTEEGITIHLNPKSVENMIYRRGPGVTGELPLEIADLITITHLVGLAKDYSDTSFFIEVDRTGLLEKGARKYFNSCVDDAVVGFRLAQIPLFSRFSEAFNTRLLLYDIRELPFHAQFIHALRFIVLESTTQVQVAPDVQETLEALQASLDESAISLRTLFSFRHSYRNRHDLADTFLYPHYIHLLKEDRRKFDYYSLSFIYRELSFFNTFMSVTLDDLKKISEFDEQAYSEELYQVTEEHLDEIIAEKIREAEVSSGDDFAYEVPGLILPRRDASSDALEFSEEVAPEYVSVVKRWHTTISDVADLFGRLAMPKESITVPRYRFMSAGDGVRINPRALVDAHIQLLTNSPRPIWQPLIKVLRYQELQLSGLDIFILLDVSASMGGAHAEYASAMAVCLIEGLQVARHRAEVETMQGSIDVRTQLLAFGASWAELTPLCKEPSREEKETAFFNLMNPRSNITQILGALKHVRAEALKTPDRNIICLIVSDGLFSDGFDAFRTVKEMPGNVYVGHISIGTSTGLPITPHHERVHNPKLLPQRLYRILEEQLNDQQNV